MYYKHPKHEVSDFTNNYITPLLDKLSNGNKDIMIMGDFNINLIHYNDDKNIGNFLDTMFSQSFLPYITTPTRITRNAKKHLSKTSIITRWESRLYSSRGNRIERIC